MKPSVFLSSYTIMFRKRLSKNNKNSVISAATRHKKKAVKTTAFKYQL